MIRARIAGTGSYLPARVLTNQDLERIVDTNEEWIVTRTGIRERRITAEGEASSSLAVNAAQRALAMAGVSPEELDVIVVGTVTRDMFFPSVGCLVQDALGAKRAAAFDLAAGCSGFIYALTVAESFIKNQKYRKALVVTGVSSGILRPAGQGSCSRSSSPRSTSRREPRRCGSR